MDFNSHLGLESIAGTTEVALETRDEHQVAPGIIHFAVLADAAESPERPLLVDDRAVAARGLEEGRRIAVAEGEVLQDGHIVAKASVTFAVL